EQTILIQKFKNGEVNAFEEIVKKYQKQVYNIAYGYIGNYEDAYDISQEVFLKVYKSIGKLKDNSAFGFWLRRITLNACTDYIRNQVNEMSMDDLSYVSNHYYSDNGTSDKLMESGELGKVISKAIQRLPKKQQKVFILRHYDGLALKDIAETLNCSLGTVKAHLFRATRRLRDILMPYVS
ncbi:TPA: sigma-70 family RNA polymerase sigma factor, partial [bacterium]|nr:sigma-70 family RNA polymerase sigma factor [bacterium]